MGALGFLKMTARLLQVADRRIANASKDISAGLLIMEQSTEIYHCPCGTTPGLIQSEVPTGATLNSLLQLVFYDVSQLFSFFGCTIPDVATLNRIMAHASSQIATFPLMRYNVEPVPGSALDKERVETVKMEAS
jgi:hypothetical protein